MNKRQAKKRRKKEFIILPKAICIDHKGELYSTSSQMGREIKKSYINNNTSFSFAEMVIHYAMLSETEKKLTT